MRVLIVLVLFSVCGRSLPAQQFDLLLRGGRVFDGTGNPWFQADIGVRNGRIVAIGRLESATAARTIDTRGKIVVPGFIDIHSHADEALRAANGLRSSDARRRGAPNLVSQGVTTVVVNQDGRSEPSIADQRTSLSEMGIGVNAALLVGHGTVRRAVLGDEFRRAASASEVRAMRALVRTGMEEGALGLSAGLEYVPGRWSTTEELVALVEVIVPWDGVYIAHQRSEGADPMWYLPSRATARPPSLLDAVRETIAIGERTGAVVVASHIKVKGDGFWGSSAAAIRLIDDARHRGVRVYADQYPYATSGSDGNTVLIPGWVFENLRSERSNGQRDYAAALRDALAVSAADARLHDDILHEIARRGGAARIIIFDHPDTTLIGSSIAAAAAARGISPVDLAVRLQLEGWAHRAGGARLRGFSMDERDIQAFAARPWVATASDAGIALPGDGPVHARFYGTFPRKLVRYARDGDVLTLADAVRSATSLPAQIMGFTDRGMIRIGHWADLAVLDLERLQDHATFPDPHQYASGVEFVFVNGQAVVDDGRSTGALPGRILTREMER